MEARIWGKQLFDNGAECKSIFSQEQKTFISTKIIQKDQPIEISYPIALLSWYHIHQDIVCTRHCFWVVVVAAVADMIDLMEQVVVVFGIRTVLEHSEVRWSKELRSNFRLPQATLAVVKIHPLHQKVSEMCVLSFSVLFWGFLLNWFDKCFYNTIKTPALSLSYYHYSGYWWYEVNQEWLEEDDYMLSMFTLNKTQNIKNRYMYLHRYFNDLHHTNFFWCSTVTLLCCVWDLSLTHTSWHTLI